jgi:hypothetical protein
MEDLTVYVEIIRRRDDGFKPDKDSINSLLERAEYDPDKARASGVFLMPWGKVPEKIPVFALDEVPLTRFLFGPSAKLYGEFIKDVGIMNHGMYQLNFHRRTMPCTIPLACGYVSGPYAGAGLDFYGVSSPTSILAQ